MSRNIVFEGWLTKSPPSKRIWRTKWRRRWFALRQSGDLPGQYFLDYYADRNCRRLKGTINLDLCEQVDAGLHMERAGNGTLDPKLRGSVFTIQTQSRTYHLEADCEAEMEKWVDAICRVCGLRPTEEEDTYQNNSAVSATNDRHADTTGPYIAISECVTGVRAQDRQSAFTFDPRNIVVSQPRATCDKATETRGQHIYTEPPRIKITHVDFSENESNVSDEDCKSLNASQSNIPDWSVTKSFTKLSVNPIRNNASEEGPPVPPRPPKTFARAKNPSQRLSLKGVRKHEPRESVQESIAKYTGPGTPWLRVPRRSSHYGAPRSPSRTFTVTSNADNSSDDEQGTTIQHSLQYYNLQPLPPVVDRGLKPRYSNHSIGHIKSTSSPEAPICTDANCPVKHSIEEGHSLNQVKELTSHTLQYLDLDLHPTTLSPAKGSDLLRKVDFIHGKAMSSVDDSAYKTVDFLKTEAFNSTREDAEALRSYQY